MKYLDRNHGNSNDTWKFCLMVVIVAMIIFAMVKLFSTLPDKENIENTTIVNVVIKNVYLDVHHATLTLTLQDGRVVNTKIGNTDNIPVIQTGKKVDIIIGNDWDHDYNFFKGTRTVAETAEK